MMKSKSTHTDLLAGWTPLHWATIRYQINFVRLLLDFGASPTDTSNSEKTPLQLITTDHSPYALQVKQVLQDRLYQNDKEHSLSLNIVSEAVSSEFRSLDMTGSTDVGNTTGRGQLCNARTPYAHTVSPP